MLFFDLKIGYDLQKKAFINGGDIGEMKSYVALMIVVTVLITSLPLTGVANDFKRDIDVHFSLKDYLSHYGHKALEVPFILWNWKRMIAVRYGELTKHRMNKRLEVIPLKKIKMGHPIEGDREAVKKTQHRINVIKEAQEEGVIPFDILRPEHYNKLLPSKDNMEVVNAGDGTYITLNGVGRLTALQHVLGPEYKVEVITYDLDREGLARLRRIYKVKNERGKSDG